MTVLITRQDNYTHNTESGLGANGVTFTGKHFVAKADGVVSKAIAGGVISGVSITNKTFAADNQTVAKAEVVFFPVTEDQPYQVTFDGTIAQTDEGKFYDLADSETADQSTASATTGQVQLVKFISATEGEVRIVNA